MHIRADLALVAHIRGSLRYRVLNPSRRSCTCCTRSAQSQRRMEVQDRPRSARSTQVLGITRGSQWDGKKMSSSRFADSGESEACTRFSRLELDKSPLI